MTDYIARFRLHEGGAVTSRNAMIIGALAILLSLFAVPIMQQGAERIAEMRDPGIDPVLTGSVGPRPSVSRSYTISRSVLSEDPVTLCRSGPGSECSSR